MFTTQKPTHIASRHYFGAARSLDRNLSSAFPSSLRPFPLAPMPQNASWSESYQDIDLISDFDLRSCARMAYLYEFSVASGQELGLQVEVLGEFQ